MNTKVYLIYGDDDFQNEKINELIRKIAVSSENIDVIYSGDKDWSSIGDEIRTYSLFGIPRLFIIRDVDIFKSDEKIEDLIDKAFSFYLSKDYERAGKEVLKALNQLELNDEELANLNTSPSLLEGYLPKSDVNLNFITDLFKKSFIKIENLKKTETFDFSQLLNNIPDGHYLIITTKELDKRTKNFKLFQSVCTYFEKKETKLSPKDLKAQIDTDIDDFIKKSEKKISSENLVYLKERAFESQFTKTKLQKLAFITYDKDTIERADIDNTFDDDLFPDSNLIPELIRRKDLPSLLKIILNPKNTKTDFIRLAGYLRSLLRNAISIKEISGDEEYNDFYTFEKKFYKKFFDILPKETIKHQHPYYLFQCYLNFKDFNLESLKNAYLMLFYLDKNLKSTQVEPKDLFIDFFSQLFSKKTEYSLSQFS